MWNVKDSPPKDRTTKMCVLSYTFQAFIMIQLISSVCKAGFSQWWQKFALSLLWSCCSCLWCAWSTLSLLALYPPEYTCITDLTEEPSIFPVDSQCISVRSCRTNVEWQSCSFKEALKNKEYFILWWSSIQQFSHKGLPLFAKMVFYFCLHPPRGFT